MVSAKALKKRNERLERQINRLEQSVSLRLGSHIVKAIRHPWRAPLLLFTLPWLMFVSGLEMLGMRSAPAPSMGSVESEHNGYSNTVVMFPTNGVGFGHFTRLLAIAKRMKNRDPTLEVIFFTTMPTLHLLKSHAIPAHHISGPKQFQNLDAAGWNALIEEELTLCFEIHKPKMFIFDGGFPYRGMLRAISSLSGMRKIWVRRGTFRKGSSIPVDSIAHFDLIIRPEDSVPPSASEIEHSVDVLTCPPIILMDEEELLDRTTARTRLMLPVDARVVYVQLGAGQINQINSEVRITVEALTSHADVHVVLGESMLGERLMIDMPRVHILRDYPNTMYFRAFDATVQAGGYNSYHETRHFGLPALFYPNMNTGMDDQLARCIIAEKQGWGEVVIERDAESISSGIERLLSRLQLRNNGTKGNGADTLAENLQWFAETGKCMSEGWMLPMETFAWIRTNLALGSRILEFGSGHGSHLLSKEYELWSIEHDEEWIGITDSNYIHAEIIDNSVSKQCGEVGWYNPSFFDDIPSKFDLIIIDGPPGTIGRSGILNHLDKLPSTKWMIIDDTDRSSESALVKSIVEHLSPSSIEVIESDHTREEGTPRAATILKLEG